MTSECALCGGEREHLRTVTTEPGLPAPVQQTRAGVCSECHDAVKEAGHDGCAWCGANTSSRVSVVGGYRRGQYTLGRLCSDCLSD